MQRPDALGDDARNAVGREVAYLADQRLAFRRLPAGDARSAMFRQGVTRLAEPGLELVALVLDDEDFLQPLGEVAIGALGYRPRHRNLENVQADVARHPRVDAQVIERLQGVAPGLAHGGDAEARALHVPGRPVEAVGVRVCQRGRHTVIPQPLFLQVPPVPAARIHAVRGELEIRAEQLYAAQGTIDRSRRFDRLRKALEAGPQAAESRQLDT